MKRIDRETVQRILDTADIVEVVSDFVNLKKRGANYIGLCPFHNERTPSFSVSRTKGICKCFSCGKGGSPVGFIMEHEQMSYQEALRYLAKKYHIEIREHEMTDEEQRAATERESLLAVNDFALNHFSHNLTDTDDGRNIGLAYFRERGINDPMIQRFKLGYALEKSDDLLKAALTQGFEEKHLIQTGLCARSDRGVYDRFRGRVIYPVFSVSGRVVAFGGRTLRKDKNVAKYVNSPESEIYHKSRELYGLYQAKGAITRQDKCILVEGYMDVISMHQVGVENVVASSGTSLTEGQIRLIHRFTENVTVIYDSDPAGIKASLRGIDLLLAEGLKIKVLLLPDGEDPDSFAQKHSGSEVEAYIAEHETDFMRFKTDILLRDTANDPIARARVITDIIRSVAVVPEPVLRAEYVRECSRMLDIGENTLQLQLQRTMAEMAEKSRVVRQQAAEPETPAPGQPAANDAQQQTGSGEHNVAQITPTQARGVRQLHQCELTLCKYIVKYGFVELVPADADNHAVNVLQYIQSELQSDGIAFADPAFNAIYNQAVEILNTQWPGDVEECRERLLAEYNADIESGRDEIRRTANDLADIENREKALNDICNDKYFSNLDKFTTSYLENILLSHPDDAVRRTATDLAIEKYVLSKVHTKYARVETERERLAELVPRAVVELKLAILNMRIDSLMQQMKGGATESQVEQLMQMQALRGAFSKYLGERIVAPNIR